MNKFDLSNFKEKTDYVLEMKVSLHLIMGLLRGKKIHFRGVMYDVKDPHNIDAYKKLDLIIYPNETGLFIDDKDIAEIKIALLKQSPENDKLVLKLV